jgi:hypothetical protein
MLLSSICAYATKLQIAFRDAGGATPCPLFRCGGRGAEFYAGGKEVRVWVKGDSPMLDATLTQIHRMVLSRGFAEQSLQPLIWDNQFS